MEVIREEEYLEQAEDSLKPGDVIFNTDGFDEIAVYEDIFCQMNCRAVKLPSGINIEICNELFHKSVNIKYQYDKSCDLVSSFYILGNRGIVFPTLEGVEESYQESWGNNYLSYLPNCENIKQFFAGEQFHLIKISLSLDFLKTFTIGLNAIPQQLQPLLENDYPSRFYFPVGKITPTMKTVMWQILNVPYQGILQRMYMESKVLELLVLQIAQLIDGEDIQRCTNLKAYEIEKIHHAKEILIRNQAEPPTLLKLAQQVGIHHMKLKQGFRELFGTTVFAYLHEYRMEMAQNLLLEDDMNVAAVASAVGYSNASQFAAAFKHKFGITPKAYRLGKI